MRVLLVSNGLGYGGAERIVEALALGLRSRGDTVQVVATTRGGPIADRLQAAGVPVEILHLRSRFDLTLPLRFALRVRRFRPELVHSHLAVSDILVAATPLGPGVRRVSTVHNSGVELDPIKRALWHLALRRFDRILPVGKAVQAALPPGLLSAIIEPSLVDLWASLASRAEARAALGVSPDAKLVLAVGRLVPIKGFEVLAEAARRLRTPRAQVVVIGDGPERSRLLDAGLTLPGAREDAARLLPAADVVVSSSHSEGFPQGVLQALAARVPVVATRVGGTPELIEDQVTGLLVPPGDPAALAQALDRILSDPDFGSQLAQAGRARLEQSGRTQSAMIEAIRRRYAD